MRGRRAIFAVGLLALFAAPVPAWALGDTEVTANQGVAVGGSVTGGTITVGMPPAQVQALVVTFTQQLGVAAEARAKAEAQAAQFASQLGFTQNAVISFFRILGEQDVPVEQMPTKLGEIAQRYRDLLTQLEVPGSTDPEVRRLREDARAALDTGDFARTEVLLNQAKARDLAAIEQMRAAMTRLQADFDARQLSAAEAAAQNGGLMMTQIRYGDAARYYAEAVGLTPEKYAEQRSERLTDWADAAWRAGDYRAGLNATHRALALDEARLPADDARIGSQLDLLAGLYSYIGRRAEAEQLSKRAIAITEKKLGPDHPIFGKQLGNLAMIYWLNGRYAEAEPLMKRAIAIAEKAHGPEHPDLLGLLNNLAGLYRDTGRLAEAEPLYERTIAIAEKARGHEVLDLAQFLHNLALLYRDTGRLAEAEPLMKRAIATIEKVLGPEHPDLAGLFSNLAGLYQEIGRYAEAEPLYWRAIAIHEKAFGPEHPGLGTRLNNLAGLYQEIGRYAEAEQLYRRALSVREKALGPEHLAVAQSLSNLALLYRDTGCLAEAEPLMKRAIAIIEKGPGGEHPNLMIGLADLLDRLGRGGEAAELRAQAEAIRQKREQAQALPR